MDNTTEIESPEVFNKELLEAIAGSDDGHLKKASAAASKMVDFADPEFYRGDKFVVFFSKITMLGWIILDQVLRATVMVLV
ncbi:MAG: hypothetical protein WCQ16_05010 [Verrucomicrobiae bacterium]